MKKIFTLVIFAALISIKASAQSGISDLFKGSPDDLSKLINAYADPLFKGFGNSLNGGYTNTAKTQKLLRFCIRVSASGSIVPQSDKSYDVNALGLSSNIKPTDPNQTIAPTFGGSTNNGPSLTVYDPAHNGNPLYSYKFNLPAGIVSIIPAPQVQLTVGLIKNTDVSLRFIPDTKLSSDVGTVGMFGFGIKHNIAQDFGTAAKLVPFDLALAFGYTRLNYSLPLDVKPQSGSSVNGSTDFSNQRLEGHFTGINIQAIISKRLLFFTPFAAVGYSSSQTDVGVLGNYPFVSGVTPLGQPTYTTYTDPIRITDSGSTSGLHADAGFQLSLTFFKIYASYSFASYQAVNAGIGLGF